MQVSLLLWSLLPMHASAEVIFRSVVAAGAFGAPDGVDKMLQVVDDAFPGPELGGNVGDTLMITVVNRLGTATFSIHWHGLSQQGFCQNDFSPNGYGPLPLLFLYEGNCECGPKVE